jgi:hypothetical protein
MIRMISSIKSRLRPWKADSSSHRVRNVVSNVPRKFEVDQRVHILDRFKSKKSLQHTFKWRSAEVISTSGTDIQIHFVGWDSRWDEWINTADAPHRVRQLHEHVPEGHVGPDGNPLSDSPEVSQPAKRKGSRSRSVGNIDSDASSSSYTDKIILPESSARDGKMGKPPRVKPQPATLLETGVRTGNQRNSDVMPVRSSGSRKSAGDPQAWDEDQSENNNPPRSPKVAGRRSTRVQSLLSDRAGPSTADDDGLEPADPDGGSPGSEENNRKPTKAKALCCDKCDGKHLTEQCPHFRKGRDKHPDALPAAKKPQLGRNAQREILRGARVVRQPPDGSCLYHSLSFGLQDGSHASTLRRQIASFIRENPNLNISDTPMKDWVKWDSGSSVQQYAQQVLYVLFPGLFLYCLTFLVLRKMARGGWGGGIEMAAVSRMKGVNVHVYEKCMLGYKRISCFDDPGASQTIRVLYQGGVHYDALVK